MAKRKYISPAKTKYDKSHPIISIRVTPDFKKKLKDIKTMSDKSPADVIKEAVGLPIYSTSDAYTKGYLTAEIIYCVTYNCSVCGKVLKIDTPNERKSVAQYMKDHGWRHTECLKE